MKLRCVWEHNGGDTLLYAADYPGAYTRGASLDAALAKMPHEARAYAAWARLPDPKFEAVEIVQEHESRLQIADADSDVLFDAEKAPLTWEAYTVLKALALKSAADFSALYLSIPEKDFSLLSARQTFYGTMPRTANEMYEHTKNVNGYYFGEIGVDTDNSGTILECRTKGFAALEQSSGFLTRPAAEGSYGEWWSLRKVCRRFLWHDRIHAKAMYRMARKFLTCPALKNPFLFP